MIKSVVLVLLCMTLTCFYQSSLSLPNILRILYFHEGDKEQELKVFCATEYHQGSLLPQLEQLLEFQFLLLLTLTPLNRTLSDGSTSMGKETFTGE